jgi:hypothetical protein
MPDEWVVLRGDIACALRGEELRIPMKLPPMHGHGLVAHRHI